MIKARLPRAGTGPVTCYFMSSPERIRTAATALRGRRPGPLDDGARHCIVGYREARRQMDIAQHPGWRRGPGQRPGASPGPAPLALAKPWACLVRIQEPGNAIPDRML